MKQLKLSIALVLAAGMIAASWRGWLPYSLTETIGFVTGAACVYLVVRENIWNFPFGIANNLFFLVLFSQARLYGDAGLQIVYIGLGAHGWYWWLRGGENRAPRRVAHASLAHLGLLAGLVVVGTAGLTVALRVVAGSAPVLDAFTTVLSLAAQYLLNWKFVETWYFWIAADVVYIYLYVSRGLDLTAILYAVFLCLCITGLIRWKRGLADEADTGEAGRDADPEAVRE